jgi:hypothetical protein
MPSHRTVPPFRRSAHESALTDTRLDQASLLRLDIAARDRGEVDMEAARKLALRRQPVGRR